MTLAELRSLLDEFIDHLVVTEPKELYGILVSYKAFSLEGQGPEAGRVEIRLDTRSSGGISASPNIGLKDIVGVEGTSEYVALHLAANLGRIMLYREQIK